MTRIDIYGKPGCAKCDTTKNKVNHFMGKWGLAEEVNVTFYDMNTPDGLAEGAFNDVISIPTTIVRKATDDGARWDGVVPPTNSIRDLVAAQNA